ncbi:MAG TPA: carboxypeptidase-like regulatory domain-containing protein, partial [Dyadobacter sp.]|nr:carboxypeptidase-like regulatory domain-containing protein [Dyadobacter sp.]
MTQSIRSCLSVLLAVLFCAYEAAGQDRRVKGKVTDESNAGIPGVSVLVKGTNNGTNTDADGNFTIALSAGSHVLTVSSIGHVTQDVNVPAGMTELTVKLKADVKSLGEVVVTALGVQRSTRNVGYAVQQIDGGGIQ